MPEDWLAFGNPWEFERPESDYAIGFGGQVEAVAGAGGKVAPRLEARPRRSRRSAYDTPIVGWRGRHVNTLRLWSARAPDPLRLDAFNAGDHVGALADRVRAEAISKVLYPSDATPAGQELRLRQEYFFASASLQDLVRRHVKQHGDIRSLADKVAIQLNDTHPVDRHRRADAHPGRSSTASTGRRPGRSPRRCSPTPTTRCCRRRWRPGR